MNKIQEIYNHIKNDIYLWPKSRIEYEKIKMAYYVKYWNLDFNEIPTSGYHYYYLSVCTLRIIGYEKIVPPSKGTLHYTVK